MDRLTAPLARLHPNAWNPNRMNERQYAAERESIRTYGFIDPITVRPHPSEEGHYEIVDGEHRWRAAAEEGVDPVPIVVLDVTELEARKLTVILNETRGQASVPDLAALLASLKTDMSVDELLLGLPYAPAELEELLGIADFDWGLASEAPTEPEPAPSDPEGWQRVNAVMSDGAYQVLRRARAVVAGMCDLNDDADIAWGQVMEALAADFMAGH